MHSGRQNWAGPADEHQRMDGRWRMDEPSFLVAKKNFRGFFREYSVFGRGEEIFLSFFDPKPVFGRGEENFSAFFDPKRFLGVFSGRSIR